MFFVVIFVPVFFAYVVATPFLNTAIADICMGLGCIGGLMLGSLSAQVVQIHYDNQIAECIEETRYQYITANTSRRGWWKW